MEGSINFAFPSFLIPLADTYIRVARLEENCNKDTSKLISVDSGNTCYINDKRDIHFIPNMFVIPAYIAGRT